jgi:hypothetical protein
VDRQPVAVVAAHDRDEGAVRGKDDDHAHCALWDGDASGAGGCGIAVAEVPRHPAAWLADFAAPAEG